MATKRPAPHNFDQPRVPPMHSLSDVLTPKKLQIFQMDLLSPSKEEESSMAITPRHKRRASESHTGLTPGLSELLPTRAKRSRPSLESDDEGNKKSSVLSPMKSLASLDDSYDTDVGMDAKHVFNNSPGSPGNDFKAMLDDIEVSPITDDGESFLKRKSSCNIRRCRSMEIRQRLIDMTNTPPDSFKKSLFKKPARPGSGEKSKETRPAYDSPDLASSGAKPSESDPCESDDHRRIKEHVDALHTEDLVADGSRRYCLPLVEGKHLDLKNIDHETMALLVSNKYPKVFDQMTIIDCRYPYEYNGGHIKGAINIYTEEAMVEFLNKEIKESTNSSLTHILVFHCEFSSHRGPGLLRHLRNCDRQMNLHQYPQLTFPEIYCLFGGYKEFYTNHPHLCEPPAYTPMVDEKHASDLRHFRAKAKSWTAGERYRQRQCDL